ncbi:MAG: glutamate--tRNA ligase [Candidatus Omnitrophica bacterium]|nr:glutamate--tRNA ligase [Candidatus Omnitrophota bacterium]
MTVVRFAPSPTGNLHIGGARTGLFNWLYARNTKGKFILRIEDTDINRSRQEYVDEILGSLSWLGLNWDELHFQSKRFDLYREHAEKLVAAGKARREGEAVIFDIPREESVKIYDVIHGEIVIEAEHIKDQVLLKSDGSPTYNFCCVIDDALMGVTHIIRGDDHIANTPKQLMLYDALGFKPPKFAHIPMILGEDKSRMSKRHGATAISDYRRQGFLPEAMVNYLVLLGWNPGTNKELFTLAQIVKDFSLKRVNKTAAVFDMDRLRWMNSQYIKTTEVEKLTELLVPYLRQAGYLGQEYDAAWLGGLIKLYQTRFQTLEHFVELTGFFFKDAIAYDQAAVEQHLSAPAVADYLAALADMLRQTEPFDIATIEQNARQLVERLGVKTGDIIHPARVALTGGTVSPGIFEVMSFMGKECCVRRLETVVKKIRTRTQLFDKLEGI